MVLEMSEIKLFFLNENYQKLTDLLISKHRFDNLFIDYIELSLATPLEYKTMSVDSKIRKKFYDSDALYVDEEVYLSVFSSGISGLYLVPVDLKFSDGISFKYYRVDTRYQLDVICENKSIFDEDGDIEKIYFDYEKINKIGKNKLNFFKISGLDAYQYVVSDKVKEKLLPFSDDVQLKDEDEYEVLW